MGSGGMIPQELLTTIAEIASNSAISFYKEETRKAEKQRKSNQIKKIKEQLAGYRRIKKALEDEKEFTETEKAEYRWKFVEDLMGNANGYTSRSERIIADEEKRRQENLYSMYRIESAIKLYKEECNLSSNEEDKRRFRAIQAMYMDDVPMTVEEIAESENVSEKTVYRDLGIAYQILAIYLYGI